MRTEDLPFPMNEVAFLSMKRGDTSAAYSSVRGQEVSLIAQMISLNLILADIHELHVQMVNGRMSGAQDTLEALSARLESWHQSLPDYWQATPENLEHYGAIGLGRLFVASHLGYLHFSELLFYSFLQEAGTTPDCEDMVHEYAARCKSYSAQLCDLVYTASLLPNCKVLYTMVGQNLVIASTVQIHNLLFCTDEAEIAASRQRLERNFVILTEMRTYWPVLEVSFASFRTFREACQKSMDTAFKMDDWMLRFLYALTKPVEDKEVYEAAKRGSWLGENIGISPRDWKAGNGL